jgi:hypothetical protein
MSMDIETFYCQRCECIGLAGEHDCLRQDIAEAVRSGELDVVEMWKEAEGLRADAIQHVAVINRLEAKLAAAEADVYDRNRFLAEEGYRRCDVPACNCNRWHKPVWPIIEALSAQRALADRLAEALRKCVEQGFVFHCMEECEGYTHAPECLAGAIVQGRAALAEWEAQRR